MRNVFSQSLVTAAEKNPKVLLLTGDHGYALFDGIRKHCPDQFINVGVAEQNMVGMAAGLSKLGFSPVVYGLSAFVPIRVLEQIKIDLCYENLPCVFVGDGAGVVYSQLGTSHQSTEDIACLRAVPNIRILSPADKYEMETCFELAIQSKSPVYLRMGKSDLGDVHKKAPEFKWGEMLKLKEGSGKLAFLATGSMVTQALKISEQYPDASVYSVPCIKPLDITSFDAQLKKTSTIVVVEEHSIYGGLGSAIAEISAASKDKQRVLRFGIKDRFSQKCGSYQYLMTEHGIDFDSLSRDIRLGLE